MAQFRALIKGQRGVGASRLGSKKSGITAYVDGWHSGITVEASHQDGHDVFEVYMTGGSTSGQAGRRQIARIDGTGLHVTEVLK